MRTVLDRPQVNNSIGMTKKKLRDLPRFDLDRRVGRIAQKFTKRKEIDESLGYVLVDGHWISEETASMLDECINTLELEDNQMPFDGYDKLELDPADFAFLVYPTQKQQKLMKKLGINYHGDLQEARRVVLEALEV